MLIFQINQNELDKELTSTDWLFWNNYIKGRVDEDDYVLLPAFINYIQDTNLPIENAENFLVELDSDEDDAEDEVKIIRTKRFGIKQNNDFSVWDLNSEYKINPDDFLSKGKSERVSNLRNPSNDSCSVTSTMFSSLMPYSPVRYTPGSFESSIPCSKAIPLSFGLMF